MIKYFYFLLVLIFTGFTSWAQPPKPAVALYKKAEAFKEKGMFNEAIAAYTNALAIDKKYDSAYLALAKLYTSINQADNAVRVLKEGVSQINGFTSGYINLAMLYRDNFKNYAEAINCYQAALKTDSTDKTVYYGLAWRNNAKEYYRDAVKYAIKALDIDNNYIPAYNELGYAYRQLKAFDECIVQLKKNLAISVNQVPLLYTGFCYIELKQKDEANKVYEELNKLNPQMAAALKKKIDTMQ